MYNRNWILTETFNNILIIIKYLINLSHENLEKFTYLFNNFET